jgi:hypothetical protein
MKKLILILLLIPAIAQSGELPSWINQTAVKDGDVWRFSGSVHDVSLMNIGVPLARSAALSNLASYIGLNVNAAVAHTIEGSEIDGYTETINVSQGYMLDRVAAYGVMQREIYVERFVDDYSNRTKFNVHVLLEVADADLQKAKADFARRGFQPEPVMKPKDENPIKSFIRRVVF